MIEAVIIYVSTSWILIFWCTQKMNEFIKIVLNGIALLWTLIPQNSLGRKNISCC